MNRRAATVGLGLAVLGLTLGLGGPLRVQSQAADPRIPAVVDAVTNGLNVAQNAISTAPHVGMMEPVLIDLAKIDDRYRPYLSLPDGYRQQMELVREDIHEHLAGKAEEDAIRRSDEWRSSLVGVAERLKPVAADPAGFVPMTGADTISYILSSGADDFTFTKVEIGDRDATVAGTVTLWSTGVGVGPFEFQIYSPSDRWSFKAGLVLEDGTWKVTSIDYNLDTPPDGQG